MEECIKSNRGAKSRKYGNSSIFLDQKVILPKGSQVVSDKLVCTFQVHLFVSEYKNTH